MRLCFVDFDAGMVPGLCVSHMPPGLVFWVSLLQGKHMRLLSTYVWHANFFSQNKSLMVDGERATSLVKTR